MGKILYILKIVSAFYICCIYSSAKSIAEENAMNSDPSPYPLQYMLAMNI